MRIKSIQLKNGYKRFLDLTINLGENPKKLIALVGPNGSGKSSVFDGMIYLNNAYRVIGSFGNKENRFHSMTGALINYQSINIVFDTNEPFVDVYQRLNQKGIGNTIFSYRNSYRINSDLNIKELKAVPDIKDNDKGASSSIDIDDRMTQNYQRLHIYLTKYRKEHGLTDNQAIDQVLGQLNTIFTDCLGLTITDAGDIMDNRGTLYFKKNNQPKEFDFTVLSSGEKEVIDLLLDTFLKKDEFVDSIYLIDEPELHLNTGIQKKVLIEIEKLIPDTCQIWIATHSIGFLSALQNELKDKSDVIDFTGDFSTKPISVTPIKKTRQDWQNIFKTALEDLTGLLAPNTIVYCEGRHEPDDQGEEQGLDAEVYNQIFSQTYPTTLFVSSGGSTMPDKYASIALVVLNKAFKEVELLLLKDKDIDRDGGMTLDEWRQHFIAKNPKLHRMLRRKEIENYLFDFEILHKRFGIPKDEYDKIIPDINEEVKNKAADLMTVFGIKTGMNKDGFKKMLAVSITPDTAIYKELEDLLFINSTV